MMIWCDHPKSYGTHIKEHLIVNNHKSQKHWYCLYSSTCAVFLRRWRCVHPFVRGLWGTGHPSWAWICSGKSDLHFPGQRVQSISHLQEWDPSTVLLDDMAQPARGGLELLEVCVYEHKWLHTDNTGMCLWQDVFCGLYKLPVSLCTCRKSNEHSMWCQQ